MALRRTKQRKAELLPPVIFRWDLDKTYLKSDFDSLRELMRIPFEKPEDKVAVPGVVPLIRGLREVATQAGREIRIYFISASPPQIGKAIKEKLALDGIEYDGIVFKNQLQHIVRGRFRNLREQVGYKVTELLKSRLAMPPDSHEVLFGDDWESDPIIYSVYADVLCGRVEVDQLADILKTIGVDPQLIAEARALASGVARCDVVSKIYINLERRTPPVNFRSFGPRLLPMHNYFQTAACLFEDGHLTLPALAGVAESLINDSGYTPGALANSLSDVLRRGHLQQSTAIAVRAYLHARGLMPRPRYRRRTILWQRMKKWVQRRRAALAPTTPEMINYQTLVAEWRAVR